MNTRMRVIATVAYADVFDYPLSLPQLYRWFIGAGVPGRIPPELMIRRSGKTEYVTLPRRGHLMALRRRRERISQEKWEQARSFARFYRIIPTVRLVGVTGGLAMDNADRSDDIDLFFITSRGTLWLTRALVTVLSDFLGIRRKPGDTVYEDKVCLNMFVAENALALPKAERDLFSAHEVLQMIVLWSRGDAYPSFLAENAWAGKYLPNAWKEIEPHTGASKPRHDSVLRRILSLFDPPVKRLQLNHMAPRRTTEVIRPGMIRFHPHDARGWIRKKLAARLSRFDIPLDKIFYRP